MAEMVLSASLFRVTLFLGAKRILLPPARRAPLLRIKKIYPGPRRIIAARITLLEVDTKVAKALLGAAPPQRWPRRPSWTPPSSARRTPARCNGGRAGHAAEAFVAAQLASRDASITELVRGSNVVRNLHGGSSLCCAGQRRRQAERHGRLLLHRSGGRGPHGCAAGLLHLLGDYRTGTAQDAVQFRPRC